MMRDFRGWRGTWVLRRICCLSFHQERETAAFLGDIFDDFSLALPDDACVKASAFAINIFVNFDAVFDAHAECDIRIFADAVEFLAYLTGRTIKGHRARNLLTYFSEYIDCAQSTKAAEKYVIK